MIAIEFENEHFVVADKPTGILSVPSRYESEDSRRVLGRELEEQLKMRLIPVHRLDYEVGGLILFAKNDLAHQKASAQFESRDVTKIYHALTENQKSEKIETGKLMEWQSVLVRGKKRAFEAPQGKIAVTRVKVIEELGDGVIRWALEPLTGRGHQLRYETAKRGFSILGDSLYGAKLPWPQGGIALKAVSIEFNDGDFLKRFGLPAKIVGRSLSLQNA